MYGVLSYTEYKTKKNYLKGFDKELPYTELKKKKRIPESVRQSENINMRCPKFSSI